MLDGGYVLAIGSASIMEIDHASFRCFVGARLRMRIEDERYTCTCISAKSKQD